jgi:hypothetical protein
MRAKQTGFLRDIYHSANPPLYALHQLYALHELNYSTYKSTTVKLMEIACPETISIGFEYNDLLAIQKAVEESGSLSVDSYSKLVEFLILVQLNVPYHIDNNDPKRTLTLSKVKIYPLYDTVFDMSQKVRLSDSKEEVVLDDLSSHNKATILYLLEKLFDGKMPHQETMEDNFDVYANIYFSCCKKVKASSTLFEFIHKLSRVKKNHTGTALSTAELVQISRVSAKQPSLGLILDHLIAAKTAVEEKGRIRLDIYRSLITFLVLVELNVPYHFTVNRSTIHKLNLNKVQMQIAPLYHIFSDMAETVRLAHDNHNEVVLDLSKETKATVLSLLEQTLNNDGQMVHQFYCSQDIDYYASLYVNCCKKVNVSANLLNFLIELSNLRKKLSMKGK